MRDPITETAGAIVALRQSPGRLLARTAAAGLMMAASSAVSQVVADARDRHRFRPPGRLVDIGSRRLHLMDAGTGSPAVVIVPALSDNVLGWIPVWQAIAKHTRACVYDRAGIGWSDSPGLGKRTFDDMAGELYQALAAAGIPPPYVLVGHSMGGIVGRRFAARYLDDMVGLVLVDSSHESQVQQFGPRWRRRMWQRLLSRAIQPLGLRRLAESVSPRDNLEAELAGEVPAEHIAAARAITLSSRQRRAFLRELLLMMRSHGQPPDLGSLPVTVITATEKMEPRWDALWTRMQAELTAISTDSRQVMAETGHYVHRADPALVIKVVCDLVGLVR